MNLNRRSLFQMLAAAPAAAVAATPKQEDPKLPDVVQVSNIGPVTISWSGWNKEHSSNGVTAWFTASLPVFARHADDVKRYAYNGSDGVDHIAQSYLSQFDQYVSMVVRMGAQEPVRIYGLRAGNSFSIDGSISLDNYSVAMKAMNQGPVHFEEFCNHFFANERERAYYALRKHLSELTIA